MAAKVASNKIARPIGLSAKNRATQKLAIGNVTMKVIATFLIAALSLAAANR